jgi:tripartite-type tricarboxylate transporter receptor subunit TctC
VSILQLAASAFSILSVTLCADDAWSQTQTTRTIKVIVPFPPGGSVDSTARVLVEQIGRTQNSTMVIENRPGAGTVIGTEAVARATPDGNTLLTTNAAFVINPHLRKLNYDPLTSFEPICYLVRSPMVIVVNTASPYRTLADLVNAAHGKPGELTMASFTATSAHIGFEMLRRRANIDMNIVPYSGGAPAVTALLGEHVTSAFINYSDVAEHLNAGRLHALATPSEKRIESLPDVPTVAESGFYGYEAEAWFGLFAPAKTPKETIVRLAGWVTAAMREPQLRAKLVVQGLYPVGMCGAEFGAFIRKRYDEYGRVIRETNIKAE